MITKINTMNATTGKIEEKAIYTLPALQALICYIEQKRNNFNTWTYPKQIEGIFPTKAKLNTGVLYYNDGETLIQAFQQYE